jgi:hypothetical protein
LSNNLLVPAADIYLDCPGFISLAPLFRDWENTRVADASKVSGRPLVPPVREPQEVQLFGVSSDGEGNPIYPGSKYSGWDFAAPSPTDPGNGAKLEMLPILYTTPNISEGFLGVSTSVFDEASKARAQDQQLQDIARDTNGVLAAAKAGKSADVRAYVNRYRNDARRMLALMDLAMRKSNTSETRLLREVLGKVIKPATFGQFPSGKR